MAEVDLPLGTEANNEEKDRTEFSQEQKEAVKLLRKAVKEQLKKCDRDGKSDKLTVPAELEQQLWTTLVLFQQFPFHTFRHLEFRYKIKGNEIFVDRKEKSITRATLHLALEKSLILQKNGGRITGPKKIGCFGASYLYPIFIELGVIEL